ncbi:hypothetical protein FQR65_LT13852 [Abscondita terminalis]|nr:hypothetical protein FQR65_LT13852 [Abscondita terminalis]
MLLHKNFINCFLCTRSADRLITLEPDVMDDFTTQLMQKKSDKWEIKRTKRCVSDNHEQLKCATNYKMSYPLYPQEIYSMLQDALEVENKDSIKNSIEWCIINQYVPELSLLLKVFSFYSHSGNKMMILRLIDLCENLDDTLLKQYSHFKHYLAEVTWVKGNISEAIRLFEELYVHNVFLRRRIKNMLKYLVTDTISSRSEAVLLSIIEFAQRLAYNHKDYYVLACIWKCCILSDWFTDQSMAFDMYNQNEGLRKAVVNDLLWVTIIALKNHRTEIVYRILELLIKFDNKAHYNHILEALFDYKVFQRDLRGCAEIAQWSLAQGIELPTCQQEKFVKLLMSYSNKSSDLSAKVKSKQLKPTAYNFKF